MDYLSVPKDDQVDMSRARILGTPKDEEVRAGGFTPVLFIKGGLDENNTLKPKTVNKQLNTVMGPNGPQMVEQVQAVLGREQLCTAEDLVEMMREMVKEEIHTSIAKLNLSLQNYVADLLKENAIQ